MYERKILVSDRDGIAAVTAPDHLFDGAEHQRQRCAEFVAGVREECRLGAVKFGKLLGAPLFFRVSVCIGDRKGDMGRRPLDQCLIGRVDPATRTRARDQEAVGLTDLGAQDRCDDGLFDRFRPRCGWKTITIWSQAFDDTGAGLRFWIEKMPRRVVSLGRQPQRRKLRIGQSMQGRADKIIGACFEQIGDRKRRLFRNGGKSRDRSLTGFRRAVELRSCFRNLSKQSLTPFRQNALCRLGYCGEDAFDSAVLTTHRAVAVVEIAFLDIAEPIERQELVV